DHDQDVGEPRAVQRDRDVREHESAKLPVRGLDSSPSDDRKDPPDDDPAKEQRPNQGCPDDPWDRPLLGGLRFEARIGAGNVVERIRYRVRLPCPPWLAPVRPKPVFLAGAPP